MARSARSRLCSSYNKDTRSYYTVLQRDRVGTLPRSIAVATLPPATLYPEVSTTSFPPRIKAISPQAVQVPMVGEEEAEVAGRGGADLSDREGSRRTKWP